MSDTPACTPEQLRWWRRGFSTGRLSATLRLELLQAELAARAPCSACLALAAEVERLAEGLAALDELGAVDAPPCHHEGQLDSSCIKRQAAAAAELQRLRNRIAELEAQADQGGEA